MEPELTGRLECSDGTGSQQLTSSLRKIRNMSGVESRQPDLIIFSSNMIDSHAIMPIKDKARIE